ncbi:hypothetical protein NWI01_34020 [Nitrobacter winogradskyi]|uniref:Uncharacterized protein n=1 Tax=Nitrobacter winogradskyi TaxID=913 RepID=A0A4Y3WHA9_NITWI|nr:hypothetical protein NWI01_34020 [Nitrobacter winogradskyi]
MRCAARPHAAQRARLASVSPVVPKPIAERRALTGEEVIRCRPEVMAAETAVLDRKRARKSPRLPPRCRRSQYVARKKSYLI